MSAPIFIPFNFNPVETSVKTSNYTIPAGRYAYVRECDASYNFFYFGYDNITITVNDKASIDGISIINEFRFRWQFTISSSARTITINDINSYLTYRYFSNISSATSASHTLNRVVNSTTQQIAGFNTTTLSVNENHDGGFHDGFTVTRGQGSGVASADCRIFCKYPSKFGNNGWLSSGSVINIGASVAASIRLEEYNSPS